MTDLAKEFCNKLREAAVALANGHTEEIKLPIRFIGQHFGDDEKVKSITPGYVRTIMNRVGEVKAVGSCSVKSGFDDEGDPVYIITLKRDTRRKVLTSDDVQALERKWRAKFIRELLNRPPRVTDLEGDELKGAAIAIERLCSMLESMKEGE